MSARALCRGLWVACATVLGLAHAAWAQTEQAEGTLRAVDAAAASALARPGSAGLQVCIARGGKIVVDKGYGLADAAGGAAMTPETVTHVCSVSKQFVAAAVLRLRDRGMLGLDDPVSKFLPGFEGTGITLRHLLTHTSGLVAYTDVPAFQSAESVDMTEQQVVSFFKDEPVHFAPGERWEYCNSGLFLLGMVVERVSGKDYGAFLRDEFFGPLKLERSAFDPHGAGPVAVGHAVVDGHAAAAPVIAWSNAFAGGGVTSTAHDLVVWDEALARGKVIPAESYAEMTRVQTLNDGTPTGYGLCWYVREHRGHPVVFHTGTGPGYSAWLARYGADDLTIAVCSNSDAVRAPAFGFDLAMAILGVDVTARDLDAPEEDLRRCPGGYQEPGAPGRFEIFAEKGRLFGRKSSGGTSRLMCQGPGRYVLEADHQISFCFETPVPGEAERPAGWCETDDNIRVMRAKRVK